MIILLDAGNTRLKWASLPTLEHEISDHGVIDYSSLPDLSGIQANKSIVECVAISSVAGEERNGQLIQACLSAFAIEPIFAKVTKHAGGVINDYLALDRLGVDRWVAALGVRDVDESDGNYIVVDAGTAVTVDVLDRERVFRGGVILPGARLMHDSLVGKTAGIRSKMKSVGSVIGRDTNQCVNAGAYYGLAGAVERVIEECVDSVGNDSPWKVIVCGGDARWLAKSLKTQLPVSVQSSLIFHGLLCLLRSGEFK
ncbi:pantothenate kinase [Arenicella sp. 4NH20-0111]|uniref:type III pantothenate kinase n=1 Tax=Arenicella sp. 4NH20-0111 TaxID=3127648 RepID=UPI00310B55AA